MMATNSLMGVGKDLTDSGEFVALSLMRIKVI